MRRCAGVRSWLCRALCLSDAETAPMSLWHHGGFESSSLAQLRFQPLVCVVCHLTFRLLLFLTCPKLQGAACPGKSVGADSATPAAVCREVPELLRGGVPPRACGSGDSNHSLCTGPPVRCAENLLHYCQAQEPHVPCMALALTLQCAACREIPELLRGGGAPRACVGGDACHDAGECALPH